MNSFLLNRAALLVPAIIGLILLTPVADALAQGKQADHIIVVLKKTVDGKLTCATNPDVLHLKASDTKSGKIRVGFFSLEDDVTVSELDEGPGKKDNNGKVKFNENRKIDREDKCTPGNENNCKALSKNARLKIAKKTGMAVMTINKKALGTYQYNVQCGDVPDDPPSIIVD